MRLTISAFAVLILACAGADDDASSADDSGSANCGFTGCDTSADADTDSDADSDADDLDFTVIFDANGALISIRGNRASVTHFGIAETGAGRSGWYGEDCYAGSSGQQFCHPMPPTGGYLTAVDGIDELDDQHTLFVASTAVGLTYVVIADDDCVTTGEDTDYYVSGLGCSEL